MVDEINYKKKYFQLIREINSLNKRLIYDRCPPFKQCCGACIALKKLTQCEKKNDKDDTRSNKSDG